MAVGDTRTFEFVDESTGFVTTLTVTELEGGALSFVLDVDEAAGTTGDARAIYFNLADNTFVSGLQVTVDEANSDVGNSDTDFVQDIDSVRYVEEKDTNINGEVLKENDGRFDVGIEFGSSGIGKDDVQHMEFILTADADLSIDTFDFSVIGFRATSVGDVDGSRSDSLKLTGDETDGGGGGNEPGTVIAEDDFFSVDGGLLEGGAVVSTGNAYEDNGSGIDFDPEGDTFQIVNISNATTTADTAGADGWFDWLDGDAGGEFRVNVNGEVELRDLDGDFAFLFDPLQTSINYEVMDETGAVAGAVITAEVQPGDGGGIFD